MTHKRRFEGMSMKSYAAAVGAAPVQASANLNTGTRKRVFDARPFGWGIGTDDGRILVCRPRYVNRSCHDPLINPQAGLDAPGKPGPC